MLSLIFCLVVVTWPSIPCNALPGILAPQTSGVDRVSSTAAWTPRPTPFVENVYERDVSPAAASTTSIPAVPTSAPAVPTSVPASPALSTADEAGIAVGIILLILLAIYISSKRYDDRRRWTMKTSSAPATPTALQVLPESLEMGSSRQEQLQSASLADTFFALPDGRPRSDWGLTPFKDDSIEYRFMALLALFGSNGVPLRELIMLASLRTSTKTSSNHWLIDGERGPLWQTIDEESTYKDCSFLAAFTREASTIQSIEIFQERLVSLGFINVEYQRLSKTLSSAQQCWFMDGRIWRINERSSYPSSLRPPLLFEVFWEVFAEMPCKDISPLAERQREIYYYHAHQAMVRLYKTSSLQVEHPQSMKHVLLVILQVLSHRFQKHDKALLRFAKQHLPTSGLHPDWNMILLVAELKATSSTNGMNLSQIRNKIFQAVEYSGTRGESSPRAKGLSGWLLVELLDSAEVQECTEVIDDTVRKGKQWMQRHSGAELSSLEQIMLCRAFARFGTSEDPEPQPGQYDLLLGYHLSRAGCIEKAEKLLLSGLEYYASSPISTRVWSYRFELVSLILRAGRWFEAEAWLASARKAAINRSHVIHEEDFWKRSGECGETFILLGLYQADCDMAMGKLKAAEDRLRNTIERTLFVRDFYIRALCLALRTRLLNVQMWQEIWERATATAHDLIEDTIASGHCLSTTRSSCSVIVIVLTLINKLLWVGDMLAAARLLESLKSFEDADHHVLPLDIKLYLERRRAAVSHSLSLEGSSEYGRHLRESGVDAEDAITIVPVADDPNSSRAQVPTSMNFDAQAMATMPSHSGLHLLKQSSNYKWSSEMERARFPTPEAEELDYLEVQPDEAKVLHTLDNGNVRTTEFGAMMEQRLRLEARRGAVHRGDPVAEKLSQAPHPPTHEPYNPAVLDFENIKAQQSFKSTRSMRMDSTSA